MDNELVKNPHDQSISGGQQTQMKDIDNQRSHTNNMEANRNVAYVVDRLIEKPFHADRHEKVLVEPKKLVPGRYTEEQVPIIVSTCILDPIVKQKGVLEIPIRRYVPKLIPIDIPVMNTKDESTLKYVASFIEQNIISQSVRVLDADPVATLGMNPISVSTCDSDEKLKLKISAALLEHANNQTYKNYQKTGKLENSQEIDEAESEKRPFALSVEVFYNMAEALFSAADYNSWLLLLNSHLRGDLAIKLCETQNVTGQEKLKDPENFLIRQLPYIRKQDGTLPFWDSYAQMHGRLFTPKDSIIVESLSKDMDGDTQNEANANPQQNNNEKVTEQPYSESGAAGYASVPVFNIPALGGPMHI